MKVKNNLIYLFLALALVGILSSCGKDNSDPVIVSVTPEDGSTLIVGNTYNLVIEVSDDEELSKLEISTSSTILTVDISGKNYTYSKNFTVATGEDLERTITVFDANNNSTSKTINYKVENQNLVDLNFRLRFGDEPLVMLEEYQYPDGRMMNFSRFSMYISDIVLKSGISEQTIDTVAFLNLTNSHLTEEEANLGGSLLLPASPGAYHSIFFNIGIPADLNAMVPADFPSGHTLANPAEHWFSWSSYIFQKTEGNIDLNGDGSLETPIALHLGSDAALRNIGLTKSITLTAGSVETISIDIDLQKLFEGSNGIYDIDANPQIHSLSQMDQVTELADNLKNIFN